MLNRRFARTATLVNATLTTGGEAITAATSTPRDVVHSRRDRILVAAQL